MKIEHIAIWDADLEQMRRFYQGYFIAKVGDSYCESVILDAEDKQKEITI